MSNEELTAGQKKGVKVAILVVMLVLLLFVLILIAGAPIADFGSDPLSVTYAILVYIPVIAVCVLAYRRIR